MNYLAALGYVFLSLLTIPQNSVAFFLSKKPATPIQKLAKPVVTLKTQQLPTTKITSVKDLGLIQAHPYLIKSLLLAAGATAMASTIWLLKKQKEKTSNEINDKNNKFEEEKIENQSENKLDSSNQVIEEEEEEEKEIEDDHNLANNTKISTIPDNRDENTQIEEELIETSDYEKEEKNKEESFETQNITDIITKAPCANQTIKNKTSNKKKTNKRRNKKLSSEETKMQQAVLQIFENPASHQPKLYI